MFGTPDRVPSPPLRRDGDRYVRLTLVGDENPTRTMLSRHTLKDRARRGCGAVPISRNEARYKEGDVKQPFHLASAA